MMRRIVRLPAVICVAAVMGWVGLFLMFRDGHWFPAADDFWTRYVVAASVLLWGVLSLAVGRRSARTWAAWGLASPLLGGLLVAPPASLAFIIMKGYIAFPVGVATGLLVCGVMHAGRSRAVGPAVA